MFRQVRSGAPLSFAVIGAGAAGMAAALELNRLGHSVTLYEAHSVPGGCASWYRRCTGNGPFQFDVGATVLNGLEEEQALRLFLEEHGIQVNSFEKMNQIFYQLGDRHLSFDTQSSDLWTQSLLENFPQDKVFLSEVFPKLETMAAVLYEALKTPVHWPMQKTSDLLLNLRLLPQILPAVPAIFNSGSLLFGDILARYSLSAEMQTFLEMTFLISAQCRPEEVPTPWAALALYFYPLGAGTCSGGMRGFHEPLFRKLKEQSNVDIKLLTQVKKLELTSSETSDVHTVGNPKKFQKKLRWKVISSPAKKDSLTERFFDGVISTIPRFNTEELLSNQNISSTQLSWTQQKDSLWGAYTAYVGLNDSPDWPDQAFNLHSKIESSSSSENGGEIYFSFSRRDDTSRAPKSMRCFTASTHCRLQDDASYSKESFKLKLLSHLEKWGISEQAILHLELGDPKTFEHFTSRKSGNVGGLPMSWNNTIADPAPQRTLLPSLYQIGDTSFPGQSVYACVMGARSVVEKISKEL